MSDFADLAGQLAREFLAGQPYVFYSAHCERGCTVAGWSRVHDYILLILDRACPHCGGLLTQHCVPK